MESASKPFHTDSGDSSDAQTDAILHAAAKAEGLTYHQYCLKYGIVGPAQERRIRRHEVLASDLSHELDHLGGQS